MTNPAKTLLTSKRFLPLFMTQFLGAMNDNIFKNALVILITYRLAHATGINAEVLIAISGGVFIFPFFLFSATAGLLSDKYIKSNLIVKIKIAEIIIMILASGALFFEQAFLLIFILFLLGIQAAFFGPLKYSLLPETLKDNELILGNGLIEAATFVAILLGTIIGGLFILQNDGQWIISIMIFTVAVLGWASSKFIPISTQCQPELSIRYNFLVETNTIFLNLKNHSDLLFCIIGISWFWFYGATLLSQIPIFTKQILHADQYVVSYFMAVFSIGIAIGSLICGKWMKTKTNYSYLIYAILGVTLFTVDLSYVSSSIDIPKGKTLIGLHSFLTTTRGLRLSLDLLLIACCSGLYTVPLYAMLQSQSDILVRARVMACNNIANAFLMVLSALSIILFIQIGLSILDIFLVIAIANGLVAFYLYQKSKTLV